MARKRRYGVTLMRPGDREFDSPDAGLKKNDNGGDRGEKFIAEAARTEESTHPHDRIYLAPPLVCAETLAAFMKYSLDLVCISPSITIQIAEEIYSRRPEWVPVIQKLGGQGQIGGKTLDDLIKTGDLDFLREEGKRMFTFLQKEAEAWEDDTVALCIMPSPLPEAVIFFLWEEAREAYPKFSKPPENIKLLAPTDSYLIVFSDNRPHFSVRKSFWEKVNTMRQTETLKLQLSRGR